LQEFRRRLKESGNEADGPLETLRWTMNTGGETIAEGEA
jgi:hypothetical protein